MCRPMHWYLAILPVNMAMSAAAPADSPMYECRITNYSAGVKPVAWNVTYHNEYNVKLLYHCCLSVKKALTHFCDKLLNKTRGEFALSLNNGRSRQYKLSLHLKCVRPRFICQSTTTRLSGSVQLIRTSRRAFF